MRNKSIQDLFDRSNFKSEKEKKQLKDFYAQELLAQAEPYFKKWEEITGLKPEKVVVR